MSNVTLKDLIQALKNQGLKITDNTVVQHEECTYCGAFGWEHGGIIGKELIHKDSCFVKLATEWLEGLECKYMSKFFEI